MRFADLIGLSLSGLWQQKIRFVLTTLGVLFGAFVLTTSFSLSQGVQKAIVDQYQRLGELRLIEVYPPHLSKKAQPPAGELAFAGNMSDAKRKRLQQEKTVRWQRQAFAGGGLSEEMVAWIAALEHVRLAKPLVYLDGRAYLGDKSTGVRTLGVTPDDKSIQERLAAGTMLPATNGRDLLISEYTLYELGFRDDEQVQQLLGNKIKLKFSLGGSSQFAGLVLLFQIINPIIAAEERESLERIVAQMPAALLKMDLAAKDQAVLKKLLAQTKKPEEKPVLVSEEFTVRGVLAVGEGTGRRTPWDLANRFLDVALPFHTAEALYFQYPPYKKHGFERLVVEVDAASHVKAVNDQIKALGLETFSLAELLDQEQLIFLLIFAGMTLVAVTSLLVAALGITNTMLMSVLERVREIGIMKAIGAREMHLRLLFLLEGGVLGLTGGILGLLLGWAASFPADAWVRWMVGDRLKINLDQSLFTYPLWLILGVPLFTWLITTLAAYYPARRAACIDPIQALRHE